MNRKSYKSLSFNSSPESDAEEGAGEFVVTEKAEEESKLDQGPMKKEKVKEASAIPDVQEDKKKVEPTPVQVSDKPKKKRNRNRKKGNGGGNGVAVPVVVPKEPTKAPEKKSISKPPAVVAVKPGGGVVKPKKAFNKSKANKMHKNIKELDKKDATHISENRLRALGINPKKYQSKLIYGNKE